MTERADGDDGDGRTLIGVAMEDEDDEEEKKRGERKTGGEEKVLSLRVCCVGRERKARWE